MNTPLYDALITYSQSKYPFHMPGHKLGKFGDLKHLNLWHLDVTEANGLDNLYEAEGIIKEAMEELSRFYGSRETLMLTNGSTTGIIGSILALCQPGDKILVARNCHHSVWHAMILSGVSPVYIDPVYDEKTGLMTTITLSCIEEALRDYEEVKGAIIVSPTYEGIVSDIEAIAHKLHEQEKWLIVDEAHGAHFVVDEYFPKSALYCGADLVIQSMHKTLPTLTQSALIHRGSDRINQEKLIQSIRMVQSSSPSYVMMGIMDYVRGYIESNKAEIKKAYIQPLIRLRGVLKEMKVLQLLDEYVLYDKSKWVILTTKAPIDGYELSRCLETQYQIVCEAALPDSIILMTTIADDEKSLSYLAHALLAIDEHLSQKATTTLKVEHELKAEQFNRTRGTTYPPRLIHYEETLERHVDEVEGYISKENIMLYPPGIPIVCIGEVFTKDHIQLIKKWHTKLKGIAFKGDEIICKVANIPIQ